MDTVILYVVPLTSYMFTVFHMHLKNILLQNGLVLFSHLQMPEFRKCL